MSDAILILKPRHCGFISPPHSTGLPTHSHYAQAQTTCEFHNYPDALVPRHAQSTDPWCQGVWILLKFVSTTGTEKQKTRTPASGEIANEITIWNRLLNKPCGRSPPLTCPWLRLPKREITSHHSLLTLQAFVSSFPAEPTPPLRCFHGSTYQRVCYINDSWGGGGEYCSILSLTLFSRG